MINLNKEYNTPSGGQNTDLFKEVLAWLKPNSPVYGWEPGVGEDEFVIPVSRSGNMMVALGEFNVPFFSKDYKSRQQQNLAKVINPQDIDYSTNATKRFVSYYLRTARMPAGCSTALWRTTTPIRRSRTCT